jgi:hypothetical protein
LDSCLSNFYPKNKICQECPINCLACTFKTISNIIECSECDVNFFLEEGKVIIILKEIKKNFQLKIKI